MKILAWLLLIPAGLLLGAGIVSLLSLLLANTLVSIDFPAFGYWESFWIVVVIWLWKLPAALARSFD